MVDITVVSCSIHHTSLGKQMLVASPQLLPKCAVVRRQTVAQYDLLSHVIDVNPLEHWATQYNKLQMKSLKMGWN